MCLSLSALTLFLNMLPAEIVDRTMPEVITVYTDGAPVAWTATDDRWCTTAPQDTAFEGARR